MVDETIRTHTSYAHCARMLKKANEDLQNLKKYLDTSLPNNYYNYIKNMKTARDSKSPPVGIDAKIATAETQLKAFERTEQEARALVGKYLPQLQALESSENFWEATTSKYDEYMYIVEEETCTSTRTNWQTVAAACQPGKWGMPLPALPAGEPTFTFSHRAVNYTGVNQTDAVRIWNHNVTLDNLTITDPRVYSKAHRDAIQLIPPPKYEDKIGTDGKTTKIKLADQMVGTILENPTVNQCKVHAPTGPLQGIFMSDGLCRNATITNNEITVQGAHAISLAGVLSGNITGNTLHEVAVPEPIPPAKKQAQLPPRIRLFPLRIGGNMADDGVVCIFGFAAGNSVSYGNVADSGNKVIRLGGSTEAIKVEDLRKELPPEFSKMGVGLTDFNYDEYFRLCSTLTMRQFQTYDKWGYDQMVAWVNLRYQEYSSGQRIPPDSPLPAPSDEQQDPKPFGVRDMLLKAKTSLQGNAATFLDTRLADLQETAIRSFTMKRIAIKNGKVVPLYDLGGYNARREAMLKWLVGSGDLANLVPNSNQASTYKIRVIDSIGQTIKNIPFFIEMGDGSLYKGFSDSNGFILNIPTKETGKLKIILGVQALEKW